MKKWQPLTRRWRQLSITSKFSLAFAVLLLLMVVMALTSLLTLNTVSQQIDAIILRGEAAQAHQQITQISRLATAILVVTVGAAVAAAGLIALMLNNSITRNVVALTQAARRLQQGDLQTQVQIDSADELGQLADTFNLLTGQLTHLVDDLEEKAAQAQTRLLAAIENISEGFCLYNSGDRLLLCNSKYQEMYGDQADQVTIGASFEKIVRAAARQGHYAAAAGRVETWVQERLAHHRRPDGPLEYQLSDGRWIQVNEYQTENGGVFGLYTDITTRKQAEEALQQQNDYLNALHETTIGLIGHLQLDELLETIINRAAGLLGTTHGYIYLIDGRGQELERRIGIGAYAAEPVGSRLQPNEGLAGRVWRQGQPLVINDYQNWSGRFDPEDQAGIRSLAGVPLKSDQRVVGVLGMAYDQAVEHYFDERKIELLRRFAHLASLALTNAQLYSAAQEERKRSDKLLNVVIPIGVALSAEQNFDRLLEKILLEAKRFCQADAGTLYLLTEEDQLDFGLVHNDTLEIAMGGTSGNPIDFPPIPLYDPETGQPNHNNIAAHVALTGETLNIANAYQMEGFDFFGTKAFDERSGYRSTSFLTIPLKNAHQKVLGVLQLINAKEPRTGQIISFDKTLEQMVASLSSLATVALEAYIREQNLRQQIHQLRIEIDEVKRQKQVTEIVETDFFQTLQNKARHIRQRSQQKRADE